MTYSSPHTADVVAAGYPGSFDNVQTSEPIPHVVRVEEWPEVDTPPNRLGDNTWRQLYENGYAGIPRNYRYIVRPRRYPSYLGKAG